MTEHEVAEHPLLASCWTWAGDVGPNDLDRRSPVSLEVRIAALEESGWRGVGIDHADLMAFEARYGFARVASMLKNAGIDRVELEFVRGWWAEGEVGAAAQRKLDDLLGVAADLGVSALKVGAFAPTDDDPTAPEIGSFEQRFHDTAERASTFGVSIALEAMANTNLPRFDDAVSFVQRVGHTAGGIAVDNHQLAKTGDADWSRLPELLAGVNVQVVEIGDAHVRSDDGAENHGVGPRCIPGRGDMDIAGFVTAMRAAGWQGHWGVEIIADDLRALPLAEGLAEVAKGVRAAFALTASTR